MPLPNLTTILFRLSAISHGIYMKTNRAGMTYMKSSGPIRFMYIPRLRSLHRPQMHAHLRAMEAGSILDLIRKKAELQPNNIAFACVDSGERITYADLVGRVNAVADWLQARGCESFQRCGLCCPEGS